MVNKDLVEEKINLIQTELVRLSEFKNLSFKDIVKDFIKQAAVERLLERIIMRAIDINQHLIAELSEKDTEPPKDYKETFLRLSELEICPQEFGEQISKNVGTRNVLVHQYNNIDYSKIYSSISDCLKDYHQYCDYILRFLERC